MRDHITKAPSTLLLGPPGSGKTTAIVTYIEAGLEVFVLITDPGGEEALIDAVIARGLPLEKLHWHYVPASRMSWNTFGKIIDNVNTRSQQSLADMKYGIEKGEFRQLIEVMESLNDFPDDRTGKKFGPVDQWGKDRVLVIDSMTGINKMSKRLTVGGKPNPHQGEWGIAMEVEEMFIDLLVANTSCFICCIGHIEKEMSETEGRPLIMASFLGKKLAPKIPAMFSDVVLAVRNKDVFTWSTALEGVDLKARTLPIADGLAPSFVSVVEGWKRREDAINATLEADEEGKEQ